MFQITRFFLVGFLLSVLFLSLAGCVPVKSSNQILTAASSQVPSSTAAADSVYFADPTGAIHALKNDGAEKWRYSLLADLKAQQNEAAADVRIDRLFSRGSNRLFGLATEITGGEAGRTFLFALEANQLLWLEPTALPAPNGSPVAVGEKGIYLSGNDGNLYAFDLTSGQLLWQYRVSTGVIGAPTMGADETIYVTGPGQNLHAVSGAGKQLWIAETRSN